MPSRTLSVTLSRATVAALVRSGASLHACRAVRSTDAAGVPLYWQRVSTPSPVTTLAWDDGLVAWTSTGDVGSASFTAGFSAGVAPGQTLAVTGGGAGRVLRGGTRGAVSIRNSTQTAYVCGLGTTGGALSCAFPLYGLSPEVLTPLDQILVWFGDERPEAGAVATVCTGPGLLVDFAAVSARAVTFDVDHGWGFGRAAWAAAQPAGTSVAPLVVRRADTRIATSGG